MELGEGTPDFGRTLDAALIKRGLRELCPGLHFDMGAALGIWHPMMPKRQGVFYEGRHICSMDRGMIPEFKVWTVREMQVPAEWWEVDKGEASIAFQTIHPMSPDFQDLKEAAVKGSDNTLQLRDDGVLMRLMPRKTVKMPGDVEVLGWRHTFEALLRKNLPGITRDSLKAKFGVDMNLYPQGPPEEVWAALHAE